MCNQILLVRVLEYGIFQQSNSKPKKAYFNLLSHPILLSQDHEIIQSRLAGKAYLILARLNQVQGPIKSLWWELWLDWTVPTSDIEGKTNDERTDPCSESPSRGWASTSPSSKQQKRSRACGRHYPQHRNIHSIPISEIDMPNYPSFIMCHL